MEIKENFKALDGKMIDLECKFLRFQLQETVFRGSNGSLSGHCRPFITKVQKSYDRFKMMKPARRGSKFTSRPHFVLRRAAGESSTKMRVRKLN